MARAQLPIVMCDHEDGCDEWIEDFYAEGAMNWQALMSRWAFEPHKDSEAALCPAHRPNGSD